MFERAQNTPLKEFIYFPVNKTRLATFRSSVNTKLIWNIFVISCYFCGNCWGKANYCGKNKSPSDSSCL